MVSYYLNLVKKGCVDVSSSSVTTSCKASILVGPVVLALSTSLIHVSGLPRNLISSAATSVPFILVHIISSVVVNHL